MITFIISLNSLRAFFRPMLDGGFLWSLFGLVLFDFFVLNGISTFVGYLTPNKFSTVVVLFNPYLGG